MRRGRDWARDGRHAVIALVLLGVIAVAAALLMPRFNDAVVTAKGALEKRAPVEFGTTVTLRNSLYHPPLTLRADGVARAGSDLVGVRLRLENTGDDPWATELWPQLTLVDKVGYSHEAVAHQGAPGTSLPERIRVAPESTLEGYVYFRVPAGRDLKELQFEVSPEEDDVLVWQTAEALAITQRQGQSQ